MVEAKIVITNETGLHARPAANLVNEAAKYSCDLRIRKGSKEVNLKSMLGLLSLGAGKGDEVTPTVRMRKRPLRSWWNSSAIWKNRLIVSAKAALAMPRRPRRSRLICPVFRWRKGTACLESLFLSFAVNFLSDLFCHLISIHSAIAVCLKKGEAKLGLAD